MNDPDFRRRLRETFQAEALEHLRALAHDAFELEKTGGADDHQAIVERIFRETHTLKGAARMVGENEAESLCHLLEQQLSTLKQSRGRVPPEVIAGLHRQVAEIRRVLALPSVEPVPAPPSEPAAASTEPSPSPAAGQLRVSAAKLDALFTRAEEMVGAKLTGDERSAELRELSERSAAWKRDWERLRPALATLRRFVDSDADSPIARELNAVVHFVDANHEFTRGWQRDLSRLARTVALDQRRLGGMIDRLLEDTKDVLMQPFSSLLEVFPSFVREIALQQGKEIELEIRGAKTEVDRRVLEEIKDALVHLVRNAVDHGIETARERRAAGKPEQGRLTLAVQERTGGNVEITVTDDGRGIDPGSVDASARRLGLIAADAPTLSDHDALALLFASGFSTKSSATPLSGRGLGLAIVREKAEQIGGSVTVESTPQGGTTFRFLLPITLARFRGVFVHAQAHLFVVPSSHIRRVLRLRESQFRRVKDQTLIDVNGTPVVVLSLAEILGLGRAAAKAAPDTTVFLVLLESGRSRIALRVDGTPYEQEVVMKSLGKMLRGARHYVGATIVGGGQIVPVLNVSDLLAAAVRRHTRVAPVASRPVPQRKKRILVAEDSITSRSLLKNILQTAGFEVRTAVDGADALTTLKFEPVDLLISDVQMPRLDGFELTAKIRADPAMSTLPVILITSLASRDDKARGVDAGANAYIVKSSFDQSDLLEAIGRLLA